MRVCVCVTFFSYQELRRDSIEQNAVQSGVGVPNILAEQAPKHGSLIFRQGSGEGCVGVCGGGGAL